jgi:putative oxidoreductase
MIPLNRFLDPTYCIARLIIGLMFACHGGQNILDFPPGGHGMPADALSWIGSIIELGGGFLIAFGLLTRIAAFLSAGEMAVAYFMVHSKMGFFPIVNRGERAVLYCWFFLLVLCYGPGRWSIDAVIKVRGSPPAALRRQGS